MLPASTVDQLFTGIQVNTFVVAEGQLARLSAMWTQQMTGVDRQFADPAVWDDLYAPLTALAAEGTSFTAVEQVAGTGWSYSINDKPHNAKLAEFALDCLPAGVTASKAPAIRTDTNEVTLKLDAALDAEAAQAAAARFAEETGFTLRLASPIVVPRELKSSVAPVQVVSPVAAPSPLPALQLEYEPPAGTPRMPFAKAYYLILDAYSFAPASWRPHKVAQKKDERGEFIKLYFITPQIGVRQRETLRTLLTETGHRLVIKNEPNNAALIATARRLIPVEWHIQKEPGLHKEYGLVRVRCVNAPPAGDARLQEVCEQFWEETGYRLEVQ